MSWEPFGLKKEHFAFHVFNICLYSFALKLSLLASIQIQNLLSIYCIEVHIYRAVECWKSLFLNFKFFPRISDLSVTWKVEPFHLAIV